MGEWVIMSLRKADIEGESPGDEGQLVKYYRKSKYPPGSKVPSVWDMEYDEDPVMRLTSPGGARAAAAAIILAENVFPGAPARRVGPATFWTDHRYTRRKPSDLYTTPVEADEDLITDESWPVRKTKAAGAARNARRAARRIVAGQTST